MLLRRIEAMLPWLAVGVLLAGAAQQAAVGLGWLANGPPPGEPAPGQRLFLVALLTLLALMPVLVVAAVASRPVRAAPAIALAAAALAVAHFNSFDPHYAPVLRRFSTSGGVTDTWLAFVVACAVVAAACNAHPSRTGTALVAIVCWLAFMTALAGLGH